MHALGDYELDDSSPSIIICSVLNCATHQIGGVDRSGKVPS